MSTALIDKATGELVEPELHAQNEALQKALTRVSREAVALRNELTKLKSGDDIDPKIQLAYGLWRTLCSPRSREKPGPKRREVLAAAIKRDGLERALRAIRGAARFPYATGTGRSATGTDRQRFDELELIVRNEVKQDSFEKLAWRAAMEDGVIRPGRTPDQVLKLRAHYGEVEVFEMTGFTYGPIAGLAEWWAPCPLHDVGIMAAAPLRIRWAPAAETDRAVEMACAKFRCPPDEIWKAVDAL